MKASDVVEPPATNAVAVTAGPSAAQSRALADGFYLCRPPDIALATVAVRSRWGTLYDARAAVSSLAVDLYRQAQVFADIAAPPDVPVAERLPGQSLRLRVVNLPAPPFRGQYRVQLSLGEVTDLVIAHVALTHWVDRAGEGIHVLLAAAAPGTQFGLAHRQASRPPNVVKRAAAAVLLQVDATAHVVRT